MTSIFSQLSKLAKKRGLPLTEVADLAGVPRTTLWGWRNKLPSTLQSLERLMAVLKADRTKEAPTPPPVREGDKPA